MTNTTLRDAGFKIAANLWLTAMSGCPADKPSWCGREVEINTQYVETDHETECNA